MINLTKISNTLGSNISEALIRLHSFTGCDSLSAFAGEGKTSALKLLMKEERFQYLFLRSGQNLTVTQDDMALFEEFVCYLYGGQKLKVKGVSDLRYLLFCAKGAEVGSQQQPPSRGCLQKHFFRLNYQSFVWRNSLKDLNDLPSPVEYGWKIKREDLVIDWTDEKAAPDTVLELLFCGCKTSCKTKIYACVSNGRFCADRCKCDSCVNKIDDIEQDISADELDEETCNDVE